VEPSPVIHVRTLADLLHLKFLANPDTDPAFHATKINLYGYLFERRYFTFKTRVEKKEWRDIGFDNYLAKVLHCFHEFLF
jgi:hypothetical protein